VADDSKVTYRVGEFADRFERTEDGWKIAERRASLFMNT